MKKLSTINAKATMMIMPIHVGTVASLVMIVAVAFVAAVAVPLDVPSDVDASFNSCNTTNPIARTIATVTMERMKPCKPPT